MFEAVWRLADVGERVGRAGPGAVLLERAVEIGDAASADPAGMDEVPLLEYARVLYRAGWARAGRGRPETAHQAYTRALTLADTAADTTHRLHWQEVAAESLIGLGDLARAQGRPA
ncbi:hypothetical protein, partial [Nostocoides australiense]|uniref:hypothetical protein n=1 Tax=Nostocoides australiense TaxID=99480 RepID=UPI00138F1FC7